MKQEDRILDLRDQKDDRIKTMLITAVMCYPIDKVARGKWILKNLLLLAAEYYENNLYDVPNESVKIEFSREIGAFLGEAIYDYGGWATFSNVLVGSGQKRSIIEETKERSNKARTAAAQILIAFSQNLTKKEAAERLIDNEGYIESIKKGSFGRNQYQNHSSLVRIIKEFYPALYLWVCFLLNFPEAKRNQDESFTKRINGKKPLSFLLPIDQFQGGLSAFIKSSEQSLEELSSKYPRPNITGARVPLIEPGKSWKIIL